MESKISPIITIIIPAYNSEKFILKCINSIPRDKRIEIIIIDDFSKKILKNQINFEKFINIKIFRNKYNLGPGLSRNFGMEYSKGKYILFLDSDDILNKKNILELIELVKYKENADFYLCRFNKDNFPKDNLFFLKTLPKNIFRETLLKKIIYKNYPIDECWSILFNKKFLTKNNILFPKKIRIAEDEYFLAKVLTEFKNAKTFNKTIYIHNDRKNSLSSNLSDYDSHIDFINLFNLFSKLYLKKNYKKNENLLLIRYIKVLYRRIISLLFIRNSNELKNISKLIKKNYSLKTLKILDDLKLSEYKSLAKVTNIYKLKNLMDENINTFERNFGKPKNIYIYCKSLLARSLVKICENLDINIIDIVDDAKNIEKKFSNYQLINSASMIKSIKKNKLSYKIIVANNRKLTFKKIKKKLTENRISSKNILHFY
jgi:glycosyltransferase involved in cell wall biosynthesis